MADAALVGVLEARIAALAALVKIRFVGAVPFKFEEAEKTFSLVLHGLSQNEWRSKDLPGARV